MLRNRSASRLSRRTEEPAGSRARPLDFHATRRPSSRAIPFYMTLLRRRRGKSSSLLSCLSLFSPLSISISLFFPFFSPRVFSSVSSLSRSPRVSLSFFTHVYVSGCALICVTRPLARSRTLILAASHFGHTARRHACEARRGEAKCNATKRDGRRDVPLVPAEMNVPLSLSSDGDDDVVVVSSCTSRCVTVVRSERSSSPVDVDPATNAITQLVRVVVRADVFYA